MRLKLVAVLSPVKFPDYLEFCSSHDRTLIDVCGSVLSALET